MSGQGSLFGRGMCVYGCALAGLYFFRKGGMSFEGVLLV